MKTITSALLSGALMLLLACTALAVEPTPEVETAATYLREQGVMVGGDNGEMNLDSGLTRAQLATVLTRLHGNPDHVQAEQEFYISQCKFPDVPDWARLYVGYCYFNSLMVGYDTGSFGAEDGVTPAAACTVVLRYMDLPGIEWDYSTACQTALDQGLTTVEATAKVEITRGDLAVMLYRALSESSMGESAKADKITISVSSYKGNALETGTRSGLLAYPKSMVLALVSSNPSVLTVEQVAGNWVAVAKAPGTAQIEAITTDGRQEGLTITVYDDTGNKPEPVGGTDSADNLEIRMEIIHLVNQIRKDQGLKELRINQALMDAAQERAETLYTSHHNQEDCEAVLAHGYPHGFGANIAALMGSSADEIAQDAVSGWINSPGHYQTMIDPGGDTIGVGVAEDRYKTVCYLFIGNPMTHNPYE